MPSDEYLELVRQEDEYRRRVQADELLDWMEKQDAIEIYPIGIADIYSAWVCEVDGVSAGGRTLREAIASACKAQRGKL